MNDWDETPIYARLMAERESTPIYDQLLKQRTKEKELMEKLQQMVNEFRAAMDLPVASRPRALDKASAERHIQMIRDEFEKELVPALLSGDIVESYDAIIDVIYYLIGAASDSGMDIDPGFREVHGSNMSKMDPVTKKAIKAGFNDPSGEPEGKVLKGPGYYAPNLAYEIAIQSEFGPENDTVYSTEKTPIIYNGQKIGEGDVHMDNNGNLMMEGVLFDVEELPILSHIHLGEMSDVSIKEDDEQIDFTDWTTDEQ